MEQFTGGARFGWANATWPLAKLSVSADSIVVAAGILGEHSFTPDQVVEVRRITWIPVVGTGVQIIHTRSDVPSRIIFWSFSPGTVLAGIERVGFRGTATAVDVSPPSGAPFRLSFLIGAVVLWNALFLLDRPWEDPSFGVFSTLAFGLTFIGTILIRRPGWFQDLALHGPEHLGRIRGGLNIVTLVSAVLLIAALVNVLGD